MPVNDFNFNFSLLLVLVKLNLLIKLFVVLIFFGITFDSSDTDGTLFFSFIINLNFKGVLVFHNCVMDARKPKIVVAFIPS